MESENYSAAIIKYPVFFRVQNDFGEKENYLRKSRDNFLKSSMKTYRTYIFSLELCSGQIFSREGPWHFLCRTINYLGIDLEDSHYLER